MWTLNVASFSACDFLLMGPQATLMALEAQVPRRAVFVGVAALLNLTRFSVLLSSSLLQSSPPQQAARRFSPLMPQVSLSGGMDELGSQEKD